MGIYMGFDGKDHGKLLCDENKHIVIAIIVCYWFEEKHHDKCFWWEQTREMDVIGIKTTQLGNLMGKHHEKLLWRF